MSGARLKGRRREQLLLLLRAGAVDRAHAAASGFGGALSPGTLSNMFYEGLVEWAQLPFHGDPHRRTSHYWLTPAGQAAIENGDGQGEMA